MTTADFSALVARLEGLLEDSTKGPWVKHPRFELRVPVRRIA